MRKTFDELIDYDKAPAPTNGEPPPKPCPFCGAITPHAILANLSRCDACYQAYCAGASSGRPITAAERTQAIARLRQLGRKVPT